MTEPDEGSLHWNDRDLEEEDLPPSHIGYVPQFTISNEDLTAAENVRLALRLRVGNLDSDAVVLRCAELLELTGLAPAAKTLAKHLSGGQRRRLALAMELCSEPALLLCDEVTSGLDAQSEKEILALLQRIAREGNRVVIVVTHGLREIGVFDKIAVLSGGHLAYFGPPETAAHYFRVETPEEIFQRLPQRAPADWHATAWVSAGVVANALLLTTLGFTLSCALCFVLAVRGLRLSEGNAAGDLRQTLKDVVTGLLIAAPVYLLFKWLNSNCKIAERTVPFRFPFLNNLGSSPTEGLLKYDVSAGSST
jgi:ABC-type lipoprotein export system ATPase subunit